ncbi:hypothetical protein AXG93_2566s1070 [Marchantia polymorpha subsp. ruderalis]|uniref:AP2/ERF domain-containing protein n=1 Tax=Marchantia polymorpha subsp. ruderalis TaxID=1480154 RepID=A0A176VBU6_MARPO|nr:hypothetical protein AXG93_2566s1070 [Marchantia polymorpha subsp. ruderalis]
MLDEKATRSLLGTKCETEDDGDSETHWVTVTVKHQRCTMSKRLGKRGPENFSCEYKGVRHRTWGKWVAEIGDPGKGRSVWMRTFNTKEETASTYDRKALQLFGPNTHLNLESSRATKNCNKNKVLTPLFSLPL